MMDITRKRKRKMKEGENPIKIKPAHTTAELQEGQMITEDQNKQRTKQQRQKESISTDGAKMQSKSHDGLPSNNNYNIYTFLILLLLLFLQILLLLLFLLILLLLL